MLGELALTPAKCSIINSYLVLIYANGQLLNPSLAYRLKFTNITNPNMNLDNEKFVIETYQNEDVYRRAIISRNTFDSPDISIRTVRSCDTFDVKLAAVNAHF